MSGTENRTQGGGGANGVATVWDKMMVEVKKDMPDLRMVKFLFFSPHFSKNQH
jgi:hypothetical protein